MADGVNEPKGLGPMNSADNSRFETMADRDPLGSVHQKNVVNATSTAAFRKLEHRASNAQRLLEQQQAREAELKQKIIDAQLEIQKRVNKQYEDRLRQIEAEKGRSSNEYQMMNRARRAHVEAAINKSAQNVAGPGENPTLLDQRIMYQEHVNGTLPKIDRHHKKTLSDLENAREEAGITAANQTSRYIDARVNPRAIASDVNSVKSSIRNIDEIRSHINMPTGAIEQRSERLNARIQEIAEEKKSAAKSNNPDRLNELDSEERRVRFQLGINEGARDEQRYQKVDDRSLMRIARDDKDRYTSTLEKIGYGSKVSAEKERMAGVSGAEAYDNAMKELQSALESAAEAAKHFEENIHKASDETERKAMIDKKKAADDAVGDAQTRVDAAKAKVAEEQAGTSRTQNYLRSGMNAMTAAGDAAYYFGVGRHNEKDAMGTNFANIATDQYRDAMSVGRNMDVRAFMRLREGYSFATGEGDDARAYGTAAGIADGGASTLSGIGNFLGLGGLGAGAKGTGAGTAGGAGKGDGGPGGRLRSLGRKALRFLPGVGQVMGLADAAPDAVNAAKSFDRVQDGRAGGGAALDRYSHSMAAFNAADEIRNTQMQAALDYERGLSMNMVGGGGAAGGMYNYMADAKNITALGQAGLSKQETSALMQQGVATMGRDFDIKDIKRAGEVRKAGVMDTSQYISALGTLQNAGGKSEDLEKIMRTAISAGMDDAKSIMALVSGISDLADTTARTTGASSLNAFDNQAGNIASSLDPNLSATLRTQMTMDAMQKVQGLSSDTSMNIPNYIEMGKIQKLNQDFGLGLSGANLKSMLKMGVAETNENALLAEDGENMSDENEKKIREYYENRGVDLGKLKNKKDLATFVTKHAETNRISANDKIMGYFGHDPKIKAKIDKEIAAGKNPAESEDKDVRMAFRSAAYNADLNDKAVGGALEVGKNVASKGVDDVAKSQGEGGVMRANVTEALGKTDAKEIVEGQKAAKELNTSIKELATAMNVFAEKVNTGKMRQDQPVDAKNFDFPKSTQNLNEAARALKEAASAIKSFGPGFGNPSGTEK